MNENEPQGQGNNNNNPNDPVIKEEPNSDEEINTGVKFPGNSLESMLELKIDDAEISSKDKVIVELFS